MQSGFDFTTLIFIGLAVFVAWKLRSVLGTKTGQEQPPVDPFRRKETGAPGPVGAEGNVIRMPGAANDAVKNPDRWSGLAASGSALSDGLDAIVAQEPSFDPRGFMTGAKSAYEMIVTAFAQGDRKTLKGLLSKDVFDGFDAVITEREKRGEKAETTFVSVDKSEIVAADVKARMAHLTLRFVSKLITAVRDSSGAVIDGNPEVVTDVTDVWTFSRQLGAKDPNWLLVATETGA
jgi:predicted lipid-binding transport protein (Tim44 family)